MNKNMLSKGAVLLICALLVSCDTLFPEPDPPSNTAFDIGFVPASNRITEAQTVTIPEWNGRPEDMSTLHKALYDGFMNFEEQIDLERFGISADIDTRVELKDYIDYAMPECFHVASIGFKINGSDILQSLSVEYSCTPESYRDELAKCRLAADQILSGIIGNDELSDVDKALLIHDRLALWCEYDTRASNDTEPQKSHKMNGALADGLAVCNGYMYAYGYLLNQVGIENHPVISLALNHAWNIVYIDGTPYHVDVTFDDPVSDVTGYVGHTYFLRSTEAMKESKHDADDYGYRETPTDTTYDNAYWQSSQTAFQYIDGSLYYIDSDEEILYRREDGESEEVLSVEGEWLINEAQYYPGQAKLSCDGVNLLYSLPDGVYAYNPADGESDVIWRPDLSMGEYYAVYGFTYRNGQLICDIYNDAIFPENGAGVIEERRTYAPV